MPKVNRTCEGCGKPFEIDEDRLRHGRGKNCSRACQYQSIRRRVTLTCATCGQEFELKQSDVAYRTRIGEPPKYCSRKCAHASPEWSANLSRSLRDSPIAQASRVKAIAILNADAQSPERSARKREDHKQQMSDPTKRARWLRGIHTRSQSEAWRNAPHFQRGSAHPRYRGNKNERQTAISQYAYRQWRRAVYERDDYTCQHCGKRGGRLNAHHIKAWATHPELRYEISNGLTLCVDCHRLIPKPH